MATITDPTKIGFTSQAAYTPEEQATMLNTSPVGSSDNIKTAIDNHTNIRDELKMDDSFKTIVDSLVNPAPDVDPNVKASFDRMRAPFSEADNTQVKGAGESAGREYDPLIAKAEEEKRLGLPKAIVGAGERGGFMNTQFSGAAALVPTTGGDWVGNGGELENVRSTYDLNIGILQTQKLNAISRAEASEREFIRTGRRQDYEDTLKFTQEARAAADQQTQAANNKITAILNAKKLKDTFNAPIVAAEEAVQNKIHDWFNKYPDAFTDVADDPSLLSGLTVKDAYNRVLKSDSYKKELEDKALKDAPASVEEYNYLKKNKLIDTKMTYLDYQKLKATQYGTEQGKTTKAESPLNILDIGRYREMYPDAGIVAGDTETQANAKIAASSAPKDLTDEQVRTQANKFKSDKKTYEEMVAEIDADPGIKNKDRVKMVAGEVYGVKDAGTPSKVDQEIANIKKEGFAKDDADIRFILQSRGFSQEDINKSSAGHFGYSLVDSISNFLFK